MALGKSSELFQNMSGVCLGQASPSPIPMIVRVFGDGAATDVPVTPETTTTDVIECCRDPGEETCDLFAVCPDRGECPLGKFDHPLEVLQRWGSGRLVLRYTMLSSNGRTFEKRDGMKEPDPFGETIQSLSILNIPNVPPLRNMLACVCQPTDPNIFRRSPIPLGTSPLKIPPRNAVSRPPGKGIRFSEPIVAPPSSTNIGQTPENLCKGPPITRETLLDLGISSSRTGELRKTLRRNERVETSSGTSSFSSDLSFSPVKKKVAKKSDSANLRIVHERATKRDGANRHKLSDTKENSSLTTEKSDCDKKSDRKSNEFEKLPDGVQLTLSELREMACRQQAQIESQHQLLAAKEQRLRYLKEQEQRQQRVQAESERLRRLRDRVDAQELKLRKLRALRGQVDHQKQNNISLTSDLDSIRALFNEKEKELSLAVAKVEELTRQLEELRRGRGSSRDPPPPSALELDKLRRELMYRNKLNEQQNQRLYQQREALTARQEEMSAIDKRISELQERLHKKRMLNQQLANQISAASHKAAYHQLVRLTGNADQNNQAFARKQQQNSQTNGLSRGNIAAVEPYNHVPSIQSSHQTKNAGNQQENSAYHHLYQQKHHIKKDIDSPNSNQEIQDLANKMANIYIPRTDENDILKEFTVSKSDPKYQTLPYNTKFTVNLVTNRIPKNDLNFINNNDNHKEELNSHVNGNYNMHMTVHSAPLNMVNKNIATPLNQPELPVRKSSDRDILGNGIEDVRPSKDTYPQPIGNSSSNSVTTTYQKPISSVAPTSIHHTGILSNVYQTSSIKVQPVEPQTILTTTSSTKNPPPSPPSSSLNVVQSPQSLILSPPQSSSTPLSNTLEGDKSPKPALPPKPAIKPPPRQTQQMSTEDTLPPPLPLSDPPDEKLVASRIAALTQKSSTSIAASSNQNSTSSNPEMIIKAKPLTIKKQPLGEQPKLRTINSYSKLNGLTSNRRIEMPPAFHFPELQNLETSPESPTGKDEPDKISVEEPAKDEKQFEGVIRRCKKGNLKQTGKSNLSRRVSFDPLALLLDASLEGELELVKKTATQVTNPSAANDEGITALHNAICAGHLEIVKFLVEFGCDVNAQDSDGWTPLHCAASCNNLTMVKFLVEHGACIFATTLSDHETAAEKCEEDEEGFDGCSEYLYSVQEKLGILSGGSVYAVFDYTAQQPDELSFNEGQQLTILRKGDENEREWWWSRLGDKEGYVPRNLLGLYPRVMKNED